MGPDYVYLRALLGAPYVWWHEGDPMVDVNSPFWTREGPLPTAEEVRKVGCNCAGLLNLARRSMGLPPLGGVPSWCTETLEPYDPSREYPIGTVFVLPCSEDDNQGHVGLQTPWGLLESIPEGGVVLNAPRSRDWITSVRSLQGSP